jgi:hypothetical protein
MTVADGYQLDCRSQITLKGHGNEIDFFIKSVPHVDLADRQQSCDQGNAFLIVATTFLRLFKKL